MNKRQFALVAILSGLSLLLHFFAQGLPFRISWGFSFFIFYPVFLKYLFLVAVLLLFIPYINTKIAWLVGNWLRLNVAPYIKDGAVIILFLILFCTSLTATHFLGDGYLWLRTIPSGYPAYASEILNLFLHHNLFLLLNKIIMSGALFVYRLTSIVSGLLFIYILIRLTDCLFIDQSKKTLLFLITITSGFMQIFFGYVEHYPILFATILLYFYASINYLKNKTGPIWPAISLGLSLPFHLISLLLFPSLIYQYSKKLKWKSLAFWQYTSMPIVIYLVVFLSILFFTHQPLSRALKTYNVLPLIAVRPGQETILSLNHLIDVVNLHLLASPLGLIIAITASVLAIWKRPRRDSISTCLAISAILFLAYSFVFDSDKGPARDWDLLSISVLPYTILGGYLLAQLVDDRKKLLYLSIIITGVSLQHTIPWVLLNRSPDKSVKRFQMLMSVNPQKSSSAHEEMSIYYRERKKYQLAEFEQLAAVRLVPTNARYWSQLGYLYSLIKDSIRTVDAYRKALELNPENTPDRINLGNFYREQGKFSEAKNEYRKALEVDPQFWPAYFNLALVFTDARQIDSAIITYQKCINLNPENAEAYFNLGTLHASRGNFPGALDALQNAARLKYDSPATHYNLAWVLYRSRDFPEAIREYLITLKQSPGSAEAHNNLGLTYEAAGDTSRAELHYREALRLKPDLTNAWHNLQRLSKKSRQ